jgi:hypothetical protein
MEGFRSASRIYLLPEIQASQISMTVIVMSSITSEASILFSCISTVWIYWTAAFATGAMGLLYLMLLTATLEAGRPTTVGLSALMMELPP